MIYASTPATGSARHKGPGRYLAAGVGYGRIHEPNPILIAYRRGHIDADRVVHMGSSLIGAWVDEQQILRPHMEHARRVLIRLARLSEATQ